MDARFDDCAELTAETRVEEGVGVVTWEAGEVLMATDQRRGRRCWSGPLWGKRGISVLHPPRQSCSTNALAPWVIKTVEGGAQW